MKKLLILLFISLLPFIVIGKEYKVADINLKVDISDKYYVLVRNDLDNSKDLLSLGIDKENIENIMNTNNIYLDIIPKDISYEILVIMPSKELTVNNLSNLTDKMLDDFSEYMRKNIGSDKSSIYKGNHNYVILDYYDSKNEYYILNYYTVVNAKGYNFQLQKKSSITEEEKEELKTIVSSVKINILDEYKNENSETQKEIDNYGKSKFNWKRVIVGAIVGGLIGGVSSILALIIKKKKNKTSA